MAEEIPKYVAVGTNSSVVTGQVEERPVVSKKQNNATIASIVPKSAWPFQPVAREGEDLKLPPNSKVAVDAYHEFLNKAAPFGNVPKEVSGVITGQPYQPYAVATIHGTGNGEAKDLHGVELKNAPYKDHAHVLPHTMLLPGQHSSILYADKNGDLKLDGLEINEASLPDHSAQAMAIAAGKAAVTANTASKGRIATVPDSPVAHFGKALGYTLEQLEKPTEDGSTHMLKAPKGSSLSAPTPTEIVTAATNKLKETSPPNITLITTPSPSTSSPIKGVLTVTTVPRSAGSAIPVEIQSHALHTGTQSDGLVQKRVHRDTHAPHDLRRLTGATQDDGDSSSSSSSSSDEDEDDGPRNTGKTPKGGDSDDDDDNDMPRRHETKSHSKSHGKRHH
jgi:hypothetical protein